MKNKHYTDQFNVNNEEKGKRERSLWDHERGHEMDSKSRTVEFKNLIDCLERCHWLMSGPCLVFLAIIG